LKASGIAVLYMNFLFITLSRYQIVFLKEQNNMIDILSHYTLGIDQDRHIEGFSPGIKYRTCLAPYKLSGYGVVAKAGVNIFCFLKKLSDTCS